MGSAYSFDEPPWAVVDVVARDPRDVVAGGVPRALLLRVVLRETMELRAVDSRARNNFDGAFERPTAVAGRGAGVTQHAVWRRQRRGNPELPPGQRRVADGVNAAVDRPPAVMATAVVYRGQRPTRRRELPRRDEIPLTSSNLSDVSVHSGTY